MTIHYYDKQAELAEVMIDLGSIAPEQAELAVVVLRERGFRLLSAGAGQTVVDTFGTVYPIGGFDVASFIPPHRINQIDLVSEV